MRLEDRAVVDEWGEVVCCLGVALEGPPAAYSFCSVTSTELDSCEKVSK